MSTRGRFKAFLNSFLGKLAFQLNRMWFMMVAIIKSNPPSFELTDHFNSILLRSECLGINFTTVLNGLIRVSIVKFILVGPFLSTITHPPS